MAGRGDALIAMLVVLGLSHSTTAATYPVTAPGSNGGGWSYLTTGSYDDIFNSTKLYIGDILTFTFSNPAHDLCEVPPADLPSCNISNAIQKYIQSVDVTLKTAGPHGFLCSLPEHCSAYGMHLLVTVLDGSATPEAPVAPVASPGAGPEAGGPSPNDASFLRSGSAMVMGVLIAACAFPVL